MDECKPLVCGALLMRARAVAAVAPEAAFAARSAVLTSPALTSGFLRHGPLIAAAVADLVVLDVEAAGGGGSSGGGVGVCSPYIAAAAAAVELVMDGAEDAGRDKQMLPATSSARIDNSRFLSQSASYEVVSNICRQALDAVSVATALAVVPLVRHATAAVQRRLIAPAAAGSSAAMATTTATPAWRALAVEAGAYTRPLVSSTYALFVEQLGDFSGFQ